MQEKWAFLLLFPRFSLPLAPPKVLLPKGEECGVAIFRSKIKEKRFFSLYFAHLFVPLQPNLYMVHSKIVHSKSSNSKLHRCLRT